jgi:GH15 family glucan-1,4-alpha-glucosidase
MSPVRIEDYGLIGDTETAALVSSEGSIDWLCFPRFDSAACFAALLGGPENGRWSLRPAGSIVSTRRSYRGDTLVLDTEFTTATGRVRLTDCMPVRGRYPDIVRVVEGLDGSVDMHLQLVIRFDYGSVIPWVRNRDGRLTAIAGPEALQLRTPVTTVGHGLTTIADFTVRRGEKVPFVLTWYSSVDAPPEEIDAFDVVEDTVAWWEQWISACTYSGAWAAEVRRSLLTLKALTYAPTGGIVAAPTTSLPERIGGVRNWDYRYCWLRDASFTLYALMSAGFAAEARAWRDWLLRAVAGSPWQLQMMYGPAGERRLPELVVDWLPGYEGSAPVRIGNAAARQFQLDVYGEVMDSMHQARRIGIENDDDSWNLQRALVDFVAETWARPDEGIWEVRGPRRHFTHSKVMAWVAFDRAVRAAEEYGLPGDVARWREVRDEIHADVCAKGFDASVGSFTQSYGSSSLDASLLLIPLVGFLPITDARVRGTVEAVEKGLVLDGFVRRYVEEPEVDGLPPGEGVFLPCSFWLADDLALLGRLDEARELFERCLGVANELGLLSEEYDPAAGRLLGNFPQAFSHIGLVNAAWAISEAERVSGGRSLRPPGR